MAKKKSKPIEEDIIEIATEEVVEEETATEESIEEVAEPIIESIVEEEESEEVIEDKEDQFFFTQLKMINKLNNPAKAKRLSDRVLRNRKR